MGAAIVQWRQCSGPHVTSHVGNKTKKIGDSFAVNILVLQRMENQQFEATFMIFKSRLFPKVKLLH